MGILKSIGPLVIIGLSPVLSAQDGTFAGKLVPYRDDNNNVNLQVLYVTSPPGGAPPYLFCGTGAGNPWRVYWSKNGGDAPTRAIVSCVTDSPSTRSLIVMLSAPTPSHRLSL